MKPRKPGSLRLAASDGETQVDPRIAQKTGSLFDLIDAVAPSAAATILGNLGATMPENPTGDDFKRAWEEVQPKLDARQGLLLAIEDVATLKGMSANQLIDMLVKDSKETPVLRARIAELEQQIGIDPLIYQAKAEKKLTPALEKTLREGFASGEMTLKGAESLVRSLGVIGAFTNTVRYPAGPNDTLSWDGKSWGELKPTQRAALKRENPDLYKIMRTAAGAP